MKFIQTLSLASLLLCMASTSYADPGSHDHMSMEPMHKYSGMMSPEKMKEIMQQRQKHMQIMEQRLANIEALLKELVELEKKH